MTPEQHTESDKTLHTLWMNWVIAVGALNVPILAAMIVPRMCIPLVCLAEVWILALSANTRRSGIWQSCAIMTKIAMQILLITALAMLIIAVLCTDFLVPAVVHLNLYNSEIPFVTCLVLFPVTVGICLLWLYGGIADNHSRACQRRNGLYVGDNISATIFHNETRHQIRTLAILATVLGLCEYWYYISRYINTDMSNPDRFFFNWLPLAVYLLSVLFTAGRYRSMEELYNIAGKSIAARNNSTVVRFLVFSDDDLLLNTGSNLWDTPYSTTVGRQNAISDQEARNLFETLSGTAGVTIRYCFTNKAFSSASDIVHYAIFVDGERRNAFAGASNAWFNPYMLDSALASNALAPVLANELYRIHTMTMAWKTYRRDGRRLYPIRHYRPTFRFRDMAQWDLDYDDNTWFDVAHNNEDRAFFRMRKLWNRLTGAMLRRKSAGS